METRMHRAGSLTRRHAGDVRNLLMAGRTFVLQVAHPAVGAGVDQHSTFRTEPWKRLREIQRSGRQFLFRGADAAAAEGKRLRRIHADIAGTDSRGHAYHALQPAVYGWVHTVFFDTTVTMNALFGEPLTRAEQVELFEEWREGGRLFGLRDRDMPADVDAYWAFYAEAIAHTLEYNPVVRDVLGPPGLRRWLILATLPPAYRAKLPGIAPWTDADARRLRRLAAVIRTTVPRLPGRLRILPDAYAALHASGA